MPTKSQGHRPFGSREDFFFTFLHIWAWRPSWSCDQDHLSKLSFPHTIELYFSFFPPIRLNLRGGHQTGFGIQVQRGGGGDRGGVCVCGGGVS